MRKKIYAMLIASVMLVTSGVPIQAEEIILHQEAAVYNPVPITLFVNEQKVETPIMHPVMIEDRVLVPIREVFEAMGATIKWEATKKIVTVQYKTTTVRLKVDEKQAFVNEEVSLLDVPARNINGKVMIPVRFVSEALGMKVQWRSKERSVWIEEPKVVIPPHVPNVPEDAINQQYTGPENDHQLTIPSQEHPMTKITQVSSLETKGEFRLSIKANSKISGAALSLMPGKVIIDIHNSVNGLLGSMTPINNTYIKGIRTSQFTKDTTRVVLDLKSGARVSTNLSEDRCELEVILESQYLEGLTIEKDLMKDSLYFKGITSNQMTLTNKEEEKKIEFVLPNMKLVEAINWSQIESHFIKTLSITQVGSNLIGSIELSQKVEMSLEETSSGIKIILEKASDEGVSGEESVPEAPPLTGINYVASSKPVINLNGIKHLKNSQVSITDNYRERQIIFDLGKDYSSQLPAQLKKVNDAYIESIEIQNKETTKVIVETKQVYAYYIYTSDEKVQIQLVRPKEKFERIVVIDIGHGGADSGAVANNVKEKEINYNQGMALYRLLEADTNIKVYLTRDTDVYPTLQFRTELANEIEADLFISIHNNSASPAVRGTETLYYPSSVDTRGKQVAQLIQNAIVSQCGTKNRGIKGRSDLYVLKNSKMPAVLIETGFLSNAAEAALLSSPSFNTKWAKSVYGAVVKSFELV